MKNFTIAVFLLVLLPLAAVGQTVSLDSVSAPNRCDTSQFTVYYTATGSFGAKNVLTLQLTYDSTFQHFSNAASIKSTTSGSMTITVGSGVWWVRVASSNPYITSNAIKIVERVSPESDFSESETLGLTGDNILFKSAGWWNTSLTFSWNFGNGAIPQTSTDSIVNVTYSTVGTKTISLTVSDGVCSRTSTSTVQLFDCSPSIPSDAIIDSTPETLPRSDSNRSIWVVPGGSADLSNTGFDTVFVEPGGSVTGGFFETIYAKAGAVCTVSPNVGSTIIYEPGASVIGGIECNSLSFDYSNAPYYKIDWEGVSQNAAPNSAITIYPNPATNLVTITAQEDPHSIVVRNDLGAIVLADAGPIATSNIQFDVSHFAPGVYYVELGLASRTAISKFTVTR